MSRSNIENHLCCPLYTFDVGVEPELWSSAGTNVPFDPTGCWQAHMIRRRLPVPYGDDRARRKLLLVARQSFEAEYVVGVPIHSFPHFHHVVVAVVDGGHAGDLLRLMREEFLRDVKRNAEARHG